MFTHRISMGALALCSLLTISVNAMDLSIQSTPVKTEQELIGTLLHDEECETKKQHDIDTKTKQDSLETRLQQKIESFSKETATYKTTREIENEAWESFEYALSGSDQLKPTEKNLSLIWTALHYQKLASYGHARMLDFPFLASAIHPAKMKYIFYTHLALACINNQGMNPYITQKINEIQKNISDE